MNKLRSCRNPANGDGLWLVALLRYFMFAIPAHLIWEIVQLPHYTIRYEGSTGWIAFAVVHCTGGDALLAGGILLASLLLSGSARWPDERNIAVAAPVVVAGPAMRSLLNGTTRKCAAAGPVPI